MTYTPKALALGKSTVTVRAGDNGGAVANGVDTSGSQKYAVEREYGLAPTQD